MKITQFTDFSIRLLMHLARNPDRVCTVREVAQEYSVSAEHLKKIVRRLTELGYIQTIRGKHGGLRLLRQPAQINIGQLMREEENLAVLPCWERECNCPETGCRLKNVVDDALAAFLDVLDEKTLENLVS